MDTTWECVIVGGGAAGLSAALVLGRARRQTLLVDGGRPSNATAEGIGGLLGHDGRPPLDLYAVAGTELARYPTVDVVASEVIAGEHNGHVFELALADGSTRRAATVLIAVGMDYRYPNLPGVPERWGRSVFHCPFCHGWELRDRRLGVIGDGREGVERASLLTAWSSDVTLFVDGPDRLDVAGTTALTGVGVAVDERHVVAVVGDDDAPATLQFEDGSAIPLDGVMVPVTLHQRSTLAVQLGADLAPPNPLVTDAVQVDALGHTSTPGLFAAGDASGAMPSVAVAIASGSTAAAAIVRRLVLEIAA